MDSNSPYRKQVQNCNRQCCRKPLVQHAVRFAMAKRMFNTIRIRIAQKTELIIIINAASTLLVSPPLKRENWKRSRKHQVSDNKNRATSKAKKDSFRKINWLKVSNTHPYLSTGLGPVTIEATEHDVEEWICRLCILLLTDGFLALQLAHTGPGTEERLYSQILGKRGWFQQLLSLSISCSRRAA